MKRVGVLCLGLMLAACIGPNYHKPEMPLPKDWTVIDSPSIRRTAASLKWWHAFQDPTLNGLIIKALLNNADLKIAKERVREARGARLSAIGALLPNVDGNLSTRKGNLGTGTANQTTHLFEGNFDASWELDIFGGGRRAAQAAQATVESREASEKQVSISLLAEVARLYLDYRRLQQQLALTQENLAAQQETLTIIIAQKDEGIADLLDVSRVEAQVAGTEATIPELEAALVATRGNLGVLVGVMPASITTILSQPTKPVTIKDDVLLATPASVLANRPDVAVAERELAAATYNKGVAMSNWLPKVSLTGLLGFQTAPVYGNIDTWNVGGALRLPILNFGRVRGLVRQADARQKIALATYEQTVLAALAEVETTFTDYVKARQRLAKLQKAAEASRTAEELSRVHFQEGLKSLLDVLVAQQNRLQADNALATQQALVGQSYAALYKSLGGGTR